MKDSVKVGLTMITGASESVTRLCVHL